jgi:hypothetical protein
MRLKPALILVALVVGAVGLMSQLAVRDAQATITTFTSASVNLNSGSTVGFAFVGTDDGSGSNLIFTATGGTNPTLTVGTCTVGAPGHSPAIACANIPSAASSLTFDRTTLDTDASENPPGAPIADTLAITLTLTATCATDTTITVTAADPDTSPPAIVINCIAVTGGLLGNFGQVTVSASPNLLPCQGGTSNLKAEVFDQIGTLLDGATFQFSTDNGLLKQTGPDTATLTLGPNQTVAIVTVGIADPVNKSVKTATVRVSLLCGDFSLQSGVSVVVTASPNVIQCGGTSVITATGRDTNGHVVPGLGFHFATDVGLLVVDPNHAANEDGIATLTLQPGMKDANVTVSVGTLNGTEERTFDAAVITVQQFCPGPNINQSVQPGLVILNASSTEVTCGETVFIGASIKDSKVQVVADNTVVNFTASNGQFLNPDGSFQDNTSVATNTLSAPTVNGVLNVRFIVGAAATPQYDVKITAASGDKFGSTVLHAKCPTVTGAGTLGAGGTGGTVPCIPIGDNVCITPPNTGSGGLKKK